MHFYRLKRQFGQGENMAALLKRQEYLIHITSLFTTIQFISHECVLINLLNSVMATDNKGLSSEPIKVEIILCSGCSNHGSCDYDLPRNQTGDYFKIASCICQPEYTGNYLYNYLNPFCNFIFYRK